MKKKILLIQFRHETNVFCPVKGDMAAFKKNRFQIGEECFEKQRGVGTELGAFLSVFDAREDVELIPTIGFYASPCGEVSEEVYGIATEKVREAIIKNAPLDAVLIDFHGAMVPEGRSDGEGDMLEMIRELVGWEIPIISSLDLHANVTAKMAHCANALIPYEEYPHTDNYETGLAAAHLMADTLDGKIKPTMAYRRIPFLLPFFPTAREEIAPLYTLARELEHSDGVYTARFAHGFFPSDIEEMGMSVMVVTDNDKALAEKYADMLEKAIIERIPLLKIDYPTLEEALAEAEEEGDGPLVLADASDNPGAGATGDSTHILRAILEKGIRGAAVATILDEESVKACEKAGVGNTVRLKLGGWTDPKYSGGPLEVDAYVRMITDGKYVIKGRITHGVVADHGKTAVVEIAGNTVLINTASRQPFDLEIFRSHGITPEEQKILVTKSAIHYRADYGTIARKMITLCLDGYAVAQPAGYEYKNWKGKV
jgi:microcystin degradation protein MlrC